MEQREYVEDWEETIRTVFAGLMAGRWHAMPGRVTQASPDGHNVQVQVTVQRMVTDPVTGQRSYEDHPVHPDVPPHFQGGAGTVLTHGLAVGDEGLIVYGDRNIDGWRAQGNTAQPPNDRMAGYQDPHYLPGLRSDPRKLQQVDTQAAHLRSDDKIHVAELHPERGHRIFSADPSTPAASLAFDPLSQATKFIDHAVQGASGLLGRAVDGATVHDHGIAHDLGAFMRVANALHTVLCHPQNGASLNALNGLHQVLAHPSIGAALMGQGGASSVIATATLALQSATGISLSCPAGGLSLPAGSVGGSSLGSGAASSNVGALGGDLSGELPSPTVTGLHVDFSQVPAATSDAAAAAAGVAIGGLYRDTSTASGKSVLVVRMS